MCFSDVEDAASPKPAMEMESVKKWARFRGRSALDALRSHLVAAVVICGRTTDLLFPLLIPAAVVPDMVAVPPRAAVVPAVVELRPPIAPVGVGVVVVVDALLVGLLLITVVVCELVEEEEKVPPPAPLVVAAAVLGCFRWLPAPSAVLLHMLLLLLILLLLLSVAAASAVSLSAVCSSCCCSFRLLLFLLLLRLSIAGCDLCAEYGCEL